VKNGHYAIRSEALFVSQVLLNVHLLMQHSNDEDDVTLHAVINDMLPKPKSPTIRHVVVRDSNSNARQFRYLLKGSTQCIAIRVALPLSP
jgi:hypothetical protein